MTDPNRSPDHLNTPDANADTQTHERAGTARNQAGTRPATARNEGRRTASSRSDRESQAGSGNQHQQRVRPPSQR